MPSQPLAPTRRENSGASVSSRLGLCGSKVPAAISPARKARTSLRSTSHSAGRRIGSKRRAAVIWISCCSTRRHQRPQLIGAARGNHLAEFYRPPAFMAEIVAPRQRAQRIAMQDVLDSEADRAVHLMRDGGALFGGFRATDFCRGSLKIDRFIKGRAVGDGISGGACGGE